MTVLDDIAATLDSVSVGTESALSPIHFIPGAQSEPGVTIAGVLAGINSASVGADYFPHSPWARMDAFDPHVYAHFVGLDAYVDDASPPDIEVSWSGGGGGHFYAIRTFVIPTIASAPVQNKGATDAHLTLDADPTPGNVGIVYHLNSAGTISSTPPTGWQRISDTNGSLEAFARIHQAGDDADSIPSAGESGAGGTHITLYSEWNFPSLAPVAAFGYDNTLLTVIFTDLSTNDPTSWSWDFGDGSTSTSQNPTHVYAAPGTYEVTLTVTNAEGSDSVTQTIRVTDLVEVPLPPGRATVEIYVHDPNAARWDQAHWDEDVWSEAHWQDVTPESIEGTIRWGVTDASKGILSVPSAAVWDIAFLDPDRTLDPSNLEGPYFGDIVPLLPVRVNHNGYTIKTGNAESIGWYWDPKRALGRGFMRATDNISRMANAKVPEDTTLGDTLYDRARDALDAAGLSDIVVLPWVDVDPDLIPWEAGTDQSAWDWITDAAQQVLYQPYIDRHNQLGFRSYLDPLFRAREITDEELVNLAVVTTFASNYSVIKARDAADATTITRELTPKPVYGARTFERRDPTPDAAAWAQAVLEDRSFTSLRWVPGEAYPLTPDRTRALATVEAVEQISIIDLSTDPIVDVIALVLGGTIRLEARAQESARWWITFEAAQQAELPLVVSGSDPPEFLLATGGIEYLYPSL